MCSFCEKIVILRYRNILHLKKYFPHLPISTLSSTAHSSLPSNLCRNWLLLDPLLRAVPSHVPSGHHPFPFLTFIALAVLSLSHWRASYMGYGTIPVSSTISVCLVPTGLSNTYGILLNEKLHFPFN